MKSDPRPGAAASSGILFRPFRGARGVTDHKGACPDCGWPLWMHDRDRVYPDDGPAGSYHFKHICPGADS